MSTRHRRSHSSKRRKSVKRRRSSLSRYRSSRAQAPPVRSGPFDYQCVATTNGRFTTRENCEYMLEGIVNGGGRAGGSGGSERRRSPERRDNRRGERRRSPEREDDEDEDSPSCGRQPQATTNRILELGRAGHTIQSINSTLQEERKLDSVNKRWSTKNGFEPIARCLHKNNVPVLVEEQTPRSKLDFLRKKSIPFTTRTARRRSRSPSRSRSRSPSRSRSGSPSRSRSRSSPRPQQRQRVQDLDDDDPSRSRSRSSPRPQQRRRRRHVIVTDDEDTDDDSPRSRSRSPPRTQQGQLIEEI